MSYYLLSGTQIRLTGADFRDWEFPYDISEEDTAPVFRGSGPRDLLMSLNELTQNAWHFTHDAFKCILL